MNERIAQRPNRNTLRPHEIKSPKRGFELKKGKIIFMHKGNTINVAKYDQCSCTAQAGDD